jgi:phosphosulfolactate phosphohydrolase-like enzyme
MLEHDGKALIDLVDGLSLESVVLVSVTNGNLADHDAHLGGRAAKHLSGHGDQAQAITATLLVIIEMFLGSGD